MISIVVPVYNVAPYLRDCLNSILSQTIQDWEMILVDDGSDDGSEKICDEYAVKDDRIHVLHQTNGGPAVARNHGVELVQGEFVAFIDSDDLLHVQYLEVLLKAVEEQHADVVQIPYVLHEAADRCKYTAMRLHKPLPEKYKVSLFSSREAIESMLYQQVVNTSPVKLFRKEVLKGEVFPVQWRVYEDLYAMLSIYAKSKKICCVDLPVYYYFKRKDGTLNTLSVRDESALDVMKHVQIWISDYDKTLLPAVQSRELSLAFHILRLLKTVKKHEKQMLVDRCWDIIRKNRKSCLFDPKMRLKNKLALLITYLL